MTARPQHDWNPPPEERAPRRRVVLSGQASSTTGQFAVTLRNLSTTGALAEGPRLPEPGRDVVVEAGPLELLCRVVWAEPGRCGLEFEQPIPQALVVALAQQVPDPRADRAAIEAAAAEWARPQGRSAFLD